MIDFETILDKIKEEYIQISEKQFNRLINFLKDYWNQTKQNLNIQYDDSDENVKLLTELIKYFDPKKTPATRLSLINNMPPIEDIINSNEDIEEDLDIMQKLRILFRVERINNQYLIITPEGLIFLFALENSKKYDDNYRLNTLLIDKYEKFLFKKYREFIFEKFENLQIIKKETPIFTNKDVGILLFFLINGSIRKKNAFNRQKRGSEKALNCVVRVYHKDIELTEEDRDDEKIVPIRVLQSDLSVLQKKIGYAINIEEGQYFIKESEDIFIKEQLKMFLREKRDKKKDILSRWNKFKREYNHWRPILRENKICYYNYQIQEEIEEFIQNL